jgi:hypothetical protein
VEAYLARGMHIDDFAPNLSFFFSNGMDPEYTVLGRVARRIWAVAMRDRYGANERSQKLKYHIQTSGRSLHAQEIQFNDIRTTLQALIAIYDNCNSLHTNAYDEAITTPTEDSVRRAMAIQLIINREWGLAKNENPNQGAFIIDELTELVEEAVLAEFERIAERGGVLGAMETGYQRGKIQEESMHYEMLKHTGEYPIIGVNTFRNPHGDPVPETHRAGAQHRGREAEPAQRLADFHTRHAAEAPAMLQRLQQAVIDNGNVFEVLMDAVRCCSLGQITNALFEVGGQYRRSMSPEGQHAGDSDSMQSHEASVVVLAGPKVYLHGVQRGREWGQAMTNRFPSAMLSASRPGAGPSQAGLSWKRPRVAWRGVQRRDQFAARAHHMSLAAHAGGHGGEVPGARSLKRPSGSKARSISQLALLKSTSTMGSQP